MANVSTCFRATIRGSRVLICPLDMASSCKPLPTTASAGDTSCGEDLTASCGARSSPIASLIPRLGFWQIERRIHARYENHSCYPGIGGDACTFWLRHRTQRPHQFGGKPGSERRLAGEKGER